MIGMISRINKLQFILLDLEVVMNHPQDRKKMVVSHHFSYASHVKWMAITFSFKGGYTIHSIQAWFLSIGISCILSFIFTCFVFIFGTS
jgi:hypothetical protein